MSEINNVYKDILRDLKLRGSKANGTTELLNYQFKLHDIENNVITLEGRHQPHYTIGELLWYFSGRNDVEFISKFGSYWNKITDDGITSNSAYGYILKKKFGYDQIELSIRMLKEDPYSRRAVMNINTPNTNKIITRDSQCTISLVPFIRDNKLHMTAIMRSNDVITGVPFDVTYFTEIQKYMAKRLGVDYGTYTHFDVSLHLYDKDLSKLDDLIDAKEVECKYDLEKLHDKNIMNELIDYVDNHWIDKTHFVSKCRDLGIYKEVN